MIDPRRLHLKIRVVVTRPMAAATVRLLVERALDTGDVPPGIQIAAMDWSKGDASGDALAVDSFRSARRKFRAALARSTLRFALVSGGRGVPRRTRDTGKRAKPFRDTNGRYRDERGRFISKEEYHRRRKRFTREEESLLDDMRRGLRDRDVGQGAEFELTATTKGGSPRRRR